MKLSVIFQALKLLLAISEQVTELIADSDIPASEQQTIQSELDTTLERITVAKRLVPIFPAPDTEWDDRSI